MMNQYNSGSTGDMRSTYAAQLPDSKTNNPVEIKKRKDKVSQDNLQKLKRVKNLKLYSPEELNQIAGKPRNEWPEHVKTSLESLEANENRVTMHPDYNASIPIEEQMSLNKDNSLRTRVLRGRNTFMNSEGIPVISDLAKMAASPGSSFANMTMDAENQYLKPGLGQGLFNLGMDVMNVAPIEAGVLANNATKKIKKGVTEFSNFIKNDTRDFIIDPLLKKTVYRNDIKTIEKLWNDNRYFSEEGLKRLKSAGIDPDFVTKPKLTFDVNKNSRFREDYIGSHYSPYENKLHMDLPQIKRINKDYNLALTPKSVYEHEFGHRLQQSKRETEDFINKYDKESVPQMKDIVRYTPDESLNLQQGLINLESDIQTMRARKSFNNSEYFSYNREAYPHVREMRQDMVDKGYIKDIYEPIAGKNIIKYMKANPKDRISSFAGINENNISILKEAMNKLPAVAPLAIGIAASQEDKPKKTFEYGGNTMNYRGKMQTGGMPNQADYGDDIEAWQQAMNEWIASLVPAQDKSVQEEPTLIPGLAKFLKKRDAGMSTNPFKSTGNEGTASNLMGAGPTETSTPKYEDPFKTIRTLGIGMQAARTGLGWLSGAVERGRQNQYDYTQQTALGQMNPMPTNDFQPNPYSLYAKYGGNLKTIMKEYDKWTNDAQYDFGSGDNDKGKMKKGGYEIDRMLIVRKLLPQLLKFGTLGTSKYRELGGEIEDDSDEMIEGIAEILQQVKDKRNRKDIFKNVVDELKEEGTKFNMKEFRSMSGLKKGGLTPNKAREILHDGTAQGHPLTDKQRRFFGAKSKGHTNYKGQQGGPIDPRMQVLKELAPVSGMTEVANSKRNLNNELDELIARMFATNLKMKGKRTPIQTVQDMGDLVEAAFIPGRY